MNKNTKGRNAALRKADEHFHGTACDSAKKSRKSRDFDGKLRALSAKRQLDKRITDGRFARMRIYV